MSRVTRLADLDVPVAALPADEIVGGSPEVGYVALTAVGAVEVGLWRMTAGVARDVEAEEAFVVVSGSATIRFVDSGEEVEVTAGDLVTLAAGERTEWFVREAITKLYVT